MSTATRLARRCSHLVKPWLSSEVLLLASFAVIGLGSAMFDGAYAVTGICLVGVGSFLLLLVSLRVKPGGELAAWRGTAVGFGTAIFVAAHYLAGIYGSGPALVWSRDLTIAAAFVGAGALALRPKHPERFAYAVVILAIGAGISMIISSPAPAIDVWYMMQNAAGGLTHDQNIYALQWTSGVPNEVSNLYTYLPGSAVLLWPFHAAFGDVRYGLLTAEAVTALLLVRIGGRSILGLAGCLVVVYPKVMFGIEQSWIDPLTVLALVAMVYAMRRGHTALAVVCFAVALACKQYNWLFIPLAVCWPAFGWRRTAAAVGGAAVFISPWIITAPHAFYSGAIQYNLDELPRIDSLSIFTTALFGGLRPALWMTGVATVIAIVICVLWMARSGYGFLVSCAMVMAVFNFANKQSFYNQWQLTALLALAAAVASTGVEPVEKREKIAMKERRKEKAQERTLNAVLS